jgi:hypothetical protein
MTRVELYEAIRRGYFIEEKSKRELAREYGVHRRDVRRAIASSTPPARKLAERASPVLGEHEAIIDQWLRDDQKVRPKQRHTARRIWQRLVGERGCTAAESTVRRYVGRRRRELGLNHRDVYVEQEHQAGDEAQVDFGEADVMIAGALVTVHILLVRCSYSVGAHRKPRLCAEVGAVASGTGSNTAVSRSNPSPPLASVTDHGCEEHKLGGATATACADRAYPVGHRSTHSVARLTASDWAR